MGESESCGKSVSKERSRFVVKIVSEFVKGKIRFCCKVSKETDGGV